MNNTDKIGQEMRGPELQLKPFRSEGTIHVPAIPASALQRMKLDPTKWLVREILPQGAAVLAAGSKVGKSWMALDLAVSVASGRQFLGYETVQSGVLYLALEDSFNRLQDRLSKMLEGSPAPEGLELMTAFANLDDGFEDMLRGYIRGGRENVKLVIVDTLQRVRGAGSRGESLYAQDYRELSLLKALADELEICLLFVHHNRKMPDDSDPFNLISGSTGIMGVSDTIWVITKENRKSEKATLHVTGRDVLQESILLGFDKNTFRWQALGDRESLELQERESRWRRNILGAAVKQVVTACGGHWSGTATLLMMDMRRLELEGLPETPQALGMQLKKIIDDLEYFDKIKCLTEDDGKYLVYKFYSSEYLRFDEEAQEEEEQLWGL